MEDPILKNPFEFYFNFSRPLLLSLPEARDKSLAASWLKKLQDPKSGTEDLRTDYLKLFLFVLQRRKLLGIFTDDPEQYQSLAPFPEEFNICNIAKSLLEEEKNERVAKIKEESNKEFPPYTIDQSADNLEYVAAQEIPNFGVHAFYAFSSKPLSSWDETKEDQTLPEEESIVIPTPKSKEKSPKRTPKPFELLGETPKPEDLVEDMPKPTWGCNLLIAPTESPKILEEIGIDLTIGDGSKHQSASKDIFQFTSSQDMGGIFFESPPQFTDVDFTPQSPFVLSHFRSPDQGIGYEQAPFEDLSLSPGDGTEDSGISAQFNDSCCCAEGKLEDESLSLYKSNEFEGAGSPAEEFIRRPQAPYSPVWQGKVSPGQLFFEANNQEFAQSSPAQVSFEAHEKEFAQASPGQLSFEAHERELEALASPGLHPFRTYEQEFAGKSPGLLSFEAQEREFAKASPGVVSFEDHEKEFADSQYQTPHERSKLFSFSPPQYQSPNDMFYESAPCLASPVSPGLSQQDVPSPVVQVDPEAFRQTFKTQKLTREELQYLKHYVPEEERQTEEAYIRARKMLGRTGAEVAPSIPYVDRSFSPKKPVSPEVYQDVSVPSERYPTEPFSASPGDPFSAPSADGSKPFFFDDVTPPEHLNASIHLQEPTPDWMKVGQEDLMTAAYLDDALPPSMLDVSGLSEPDFEYLDMISPPPAMDSPVVVSPKYSRWDRAGGKKSPEVATILEDESAPITRQEYLLLEKRRQEDERMLREIQEQVQMERADEAKRLKDAQEHTEAMEVAGYDPKSKTTPTGVFKGKRVQGVRRKLDFYAPSSPDSPVAEPRSQEETALEKLARQLFDDTSPEPSARSPGRDLFMESPPIGVVTPVTPRLPPAQQETPRTPDTPFTRIAKEAALQPNLSAELPEGILSPLSPGMRQWEERVQEASGQVRRRDVNLYGYGERKEKLLPRWASRGPPRMPMIPQYESPEMDEHGLPGIKKYPPPTKYPSYRPYDFSTNLPKIDYSIPHEKRIQKLLRDDPVPEDFIESPPKPYCTMSKRQASPDQLMFEELERVCEAETSPGLFDERIKEVKSPGELSFERHEQECEKESSFERHEREFADESSGMLSFEAHEREFASPQFQSPGSDPFQGEKMFSSPPKYQEFQGTHDIMSESPPYLPSPVSSREATPDWLKVPRAYLKTAMHLEDASPPAQWDESIFDESGLSAVDIDSFDLDMISPPPAMFSPVVCSPKYRRWSGSGGKKVPGVATILEDESAPITRQEYLLEERRRQEEERMLREIQEQIQKERAEETKRLKDVQEHTEAMEAAGYDPKSQTTPTGAVKGVKRGVRRKLDFYAPSSPDTPVPMTEPLGIFQTPPSFQRKLEDTAFENFERQLFEETPPPFDVSSPGQPSTVRTPELFGRDFFMESPPIGVVTPVTPLQQGTPRTPDTPFTRMAKEAALQPNLSGELPEGILSPVSPGMRQWEERVREASGQVRRRDVNLYGYGERKEKLLPRWASRGPPRMPMIPQYESPEMDEHGLPGIKKFPPPTKYPSYRPYDFSTNLPKIDYSVPHEERIRKITKDIMIPEDFEEPPPEPYCTIKNREGSPEQLLFEAYERACVAESPGQVFFDGPAAKSPGQLSFEAHEREFAPEASPGVCSFEEHKMAFSPPQYQSPPGIGSESPPYLASPTSPSPRSAQKYQSPFERLQGVEDIFSESPDYYESPVPSQASPFEGVQYSPPMYYTPQEESFVATPGSEFMQSLKEHEIPEEFWTKTRYYTQAMPQGIDRIVELSGEGEYSPEILVPEGRLVDLTPAQALEQHSLSFEPESISQDPVIAKYQRMGMRFGNLQPCNLLERFDEESFALPPGLADSGRTFGISPEKYRASRNVFHASVQPDYYIAEEEFPEECVSPDCFAQCSSTSEYFVAHEG